MSADSQRLKSALRRIVLESPELRELLGDSDNRGDQAGSAGVGTSEAEESRLCCDGSTSDNANPGTDERDADADSQDGLDPDDPADLTSGDGTLSGVTDCATGEPVCFDGSGFIPPDGWDEPNEPPIEEYAAEDRWFDSDYSLESRSAYTLCEEIHPLTTSSETAFFKRIEDPNNGTSLQCVRDSDGFEQVYATIYIESCDTNYDAVCENPIPKEDAWPEDGCTNLIVKGGKIVGSKYDPENSSGDYSAPRDSIDLCDGSGNQISLAPSADGGWKTINATTDSGYLYDSNGQQIAHIDGNEYSDPDV